MDRIGFHFDRHGDCACTIHLAGDDRIQGTYRYSVTNSKTSLSNFREAFLEGEFSTYLFHSAIIGAGNVILCLTIGLPAAYAFSRFRVYGEKHLYFYILSTRMAPAIALVLPLYMFFQTLGLQPLTWLLSFISCETFSMTYQKMLMRRH